MQKTDVYILYRTIDVGTYSIISYLSYERFKYLYVLTTHILYSL